jgi:hypothetical protein
VADGEDEGRADLAAHLLHRFVEGDALGALAVDLEEGGFTQDGALTVRLLVAHLATPLPAHNDTILIGGDRYKIDEINRKPGAGIIEYRVARR